MKSIISITKEIKKEALNLGFDGCGISKAGELRLEGTRLKNWLKSGKHGEMRYMENHFEKRTDPTKLVPGAKSVISLIKNYHNPKKQTDLTAPVISKYAYGKDYHLVIRPRLNQLLKYIERHFGPVEGRGFVDSAPVLERVWAAKSGLGWIGKHSLLLNRTQGSFFFLAVLIVDLELKPDTAVKEYCGSCTRCIDACPTGAIIQPYVVDSRKCISYLTIEKKGPISEEFKTKLNNRVFGCDICQDVCPWNHNAQPHSEKAFNPSEDLLEWTKKKWYSLTQDDFDIFFHNSAVLRTQYEGFKRNLDFLNQKE